MIFCYFFIKKKVREEYDPELGRFMSEDPAGQNANLYMYAGNNPFKYMDPDGEFWMELFGSIIPFFGHMLGAGLDAYTADVVTQWAKNGFDASKINWGQANNAFNNGMMGFGLGQASLKVDLGQGFIMDGIDSGINRGLSNMVRGGSFNDGFSEGINNYLVDRTLSGASAQWGWYKYDILPKDIMNFIPDGFEGIIGAVQLDGMPFEHWQVFDKNGKNFGVLGKTMDLAGFLGLNDAKYGSLENKDMNRKYRVVGYVRKVVQSKTENSKYSGYNLVIDNCVHGAKGQDISYF